MISSEERQGRIDTLKQRINDLSVTKRAIESQAEVIMSNNTVSKKGMNRVLAALNRYPDVSKTKLGNDDEIALFRISMEIKGMQLTMAMLANELTNLGVKE